MSKFKRNDTVIEKDANFGVSVVRTPGVYDVTIQRAVYNISSGGAGEVQFTLKFDDPKDVEQTFYGMYIVKADGTENPRGYPRWNALLYILGIDDPGDPVKTKVLLPAKGGGKEEKVLAVFPKLKDRRVKVLLDVEYHRYEGEIKEKVTIERFYRFTDGASGRELIKGTVVGDQMRADKERFTTPVYKDGITASLVSDWLKARGIKKAEELKEASKEPVSSKSKFARKSEQGAEEPVAEEAVDEIIPF
jgi:hypothetical protein